MKLEIEEKTKQLEDDGSDSFEEIQVLKSENEDPKGEISLMKLGGGSALKCDDDGEEQWRRRMVVQM
ncbi:hypothetical protein PIB30_107984 [Stylosanthes scabra]|uniref:Uncharacterized protein n=1 Tax=Stylosanthes scabra TaxID=79078 RepID=A0ABU6YY34_9FABA|nr:hypothetical protein [Stylosanthes scabra]